MDLYNVFWFLAVISSGLAAGVMMGHLFLLGRFLSWFFESGNAELFRKSYPVFLKTKKPGLLFDNVFTLSLLICTSYFLFLLIKGGLSMLSISAISLQWVFVLVFFGTGFAPLEKRLFGGDMADDIVQKFTSRNIPTLTVLVLLLIASFILFVCMKI
jgi:hypothetical protein